MKATDQGTREPGKERYHAIPRTLIFLTSRNPETGDREILLIKGAPTKRLWANKYNGLGGHVEADEDILEAARREVKEEAGLTVDHLILRGVINVHTGRDAAGLRPGVLIFVFRGEATDRAIHVPGGEEGCPEWMAVDAVPGLPLVDDLYELIPRTLADGPLIIGHYQPDAHGRMVYRWGSVIGD